MLDHPWGSQYWCNTGAEIFTQVCIHLKQTHQKSQEKELACKSYAQDTLLLKFKINENVFSFKPDSINKSCRIRLLDSNKTCLAIFGFFYKFLWIFKFG
jgi:hypothetical protein